jgi:hypothetical protein
MAVGLRSLGFEPESPAFIRVGSSHIPLMFILSSFLEQGFVIRLIEKTPSSNTNEEVAVCSPI